MFCPNCGRNCGEDRFCADCGTQLPKSPETESQADPVEVKTKIPAGFPVKSTYIGERRTYLDLNETSLTVSPTGGYDHRVTIAYDQLKYVAFMRPEGTGWLARSGVLLFRGEEHSHIPIPAPEKMSLDDIAVLFPAESASIFYHVYHALKLVAPTAAKFEVIRRPGKVGNLDSLVRGINFADLWERYALRRERAVEELQKMHGLKKNDAQVLVDRDFDARQEEVYKEDPLRAIKDLQALVTKKDRQTKAEQNMQEQLREHRKERYLKEINEGVGYIELMHREQQRDDD